MCGCRCYSFPSNDVFIWLISEADCGPFGLPLRVLRQVFFWPYGKRLVLVRKKLVVVGLFLLVFYFYRNPMVHEIFLPAPTHHRIFSRYGFSQYHFLFLGFSLSMIVLDLPVLVLVFLVAFTWPGTLWVCFCLNSPITFLLLNTYQKLH